MALVFRCRVAGGLLRETDEATNFRWATPAQLPDLMDQAHAVRLLDAITPPDASGPAVREHDGRQLLRPVGTVELDQVVGAVLAHEGRGCE